MRILAFALCLAAAACAAPGGGGGVPLVAADAATALIAGERMDMVRRSSGGAPGGDPLVLMSLRHADGRSMGFEQGNHAPHHIMAQAPGGPLAQIMGLFGEEAPTLYTMRASDNNGAPFICGSDGPVAIGLYEAPDGSVQLVGLRQAIQFETRPDGAEEALPYSPDMVCARLRFRRG